jgi:hypothetical protein
LVAHVDTWLRQGVADLQPGDLLALTDSDKSRYANLVLDRLVLLHHRGFFAEDYWGGGRITLKGRFAALMV